MIRKGGEGAVWRVGAGKGRQGRIEMMVSGLLFQGKGTRNEPRDWSEGFLSVENDGWIDQGNEPGRL